MKIRLSELRRIIRSVLEEQASVPGHVIPGSTGPLSNKEVEKMGTGGLGEEENESDEDSDI